MLTIRKFRESDGLPLWKLQFETIREINIRDYSCDQVRAWAPNDYKHEKWLARVSKMDPFVAMENGEIAGYADLQPDGYIDHFYCAKAHIGKGVGGALMRHILNLAQERNITKLYSHVSITAKPFFEHFGFVVITSQQVEVRGEVLTNFVMERGDT